MDRLSIINHFIEKYGYEDYCEIGVFTGYTLDGCKAKNKVGIDPQCQHYKGKENIICKTSDDFFRDLPEDKKFQIFFIDGLHEAKQVTRDIQNSLKHLNEGGVILLHDCNPPTYEHTTTGDCGGNWNGDVYKALVRFRIMYPNVVYTVDTDWGVGVIKSEINPIPYMIPFCSIPDWDEFDEGRKEYLNLISIPEFLEKEKIDEAVTDTRVG